LIRFISIGFIALLPHISWAHGGEDHGEAPKAAVVVSSSPRVYLTTEQFELVGVMNGEVLTIYLDQFATNSPVEKAQVEVESGSWKAVAKETGLAVYTVDAAPLSQIGKHPLTVTVQSGDDSDLMSGMLEVGMPGKASGPDEHTHFKSEWAIWSGAAALLLAAIALLAKRRRKHSRKTNNKNPT
jgi:LPXTG-motif cell wall-anchored protein